MARHCHWPGCMEEVPPKLWGCKKHWFMLPIDLRNAIWDAYVPGQEITKTPSEKYKNVARKVQLWIRYNCLDEIGEFSYFDSDDNILANGILFVEGDDAFGYARVIRGGLAIRGEAVIDGVTNSLTENPGNLICLSTIELIIKNVIRSHHETPKP
jgi:hypothetical protein